MRRIALLSGILLLSITTPAEAQRLQGRLLDAGTGRAIDGGTMILLSRDSVPLQTVVTDPDGAFRLNVPGGGTYRLQAQRIGYRAAATPPLDLEPRDTLEVEFRLSADAVVLEPLTVIAAARRPTGRIADFYARAERGSFGTFITREQIERRNPSHASDLLRTIAGVQVVPTWYGRSIVLMRGRCIPFIFLDGLRIETSSIDDLVTPMDLEGIEIYRGVSEAPVELTGPGANCGVVALWTRAGP